MIERSLIEGVVWIWFADATTSTRVTDVTISSVTTFVAMEDCVVFVTGSLSVCKFHIFV